MMRLTTILLCAVVALGALALPLRGETPPAAAPAAAPAPAAPASAPAAPLVGKPPVPPAAAPVGEKLPATVKTVEGTVEMRTAVGQPWTPVKVGQQLDEGADLRTGFRARCVLDLTDSVVQIDALSVIRIGEIRKQGDSVKTRIIMKQGSAQANVEKERVKSDFAVVTPVATLSVRGTTGVQIRVYPQLPFNFALLHTGMIQISDPRTGASVLLRPTQFTGQPNLPAMDSLASVMAMHMPGSDNAYTQQQLQTAVQQNLTFTIPPSTPSGPPAFQIVNQINGTRGAQNNVPPPPRQYYPPDYYYPPSHGM